MNLKAPQAWAEIGAILQGMAAVVALFLGVYAYNVQRDVQKEATAQQIYAEYIKISIDNPKLASGINDNEKYEWFVSFLLNSSEKILGQFPNDLNWRRTIFSQLSYHCNYFNSNEFLKIRNHYSNEILNLMKMIKECK